MKITDNEIKNYSIKTTSDDILSKVVKEKKQKSVLFSSFKLVPAFACLTGLVVVLSLVLKEDEQISAGDEINVKETVLDFQINSLTRLIKHDSDVNMNLSNARLISNDEDSLEVSQSQFEDVVNEFDYFYDVIYDKYYQIEEKNSYEYGEYEGVFDKYALKITSSDSVIYLKYTNKSENESEFSGEVKINGSVYKLEGKQEIDPSNHQSELETIIYISNNEYYKMEEEYQIDDYSYEFEIKKKGEEIYSYEFEIEEDEIELEIESLDLESEYEIIVTDEYWLVEYSYNDYEGSFKIYNENNQLKYEDEENNLKIFKNHQ